MTEGFHEIGVALSLMKEALTLLEASEAATAAQYLQMAIDATNDIRARELGTFPDETHSEIEDGR